MLNRLKSLLSAVFSRGMSKLETPEVLAEEAQAQLEKNVKDLKEALTSSLANEKQLEQQIKKNAEEVEQWQKRAAVAVSQNNEDIARQCLQKKNEATQQAQSLATQLQQQKEASAALKERYAEFQNKLREFQTKKQDLISRQQASQAVTSAHELLSSPGGSSMDKWEEKIRMKEARSEAERSLSTPTQDQKLIEMAKSADVDDELAALKEQLGAAQQPKLIVDKSSDS